MLFRQRAKRKKTFRLILLMVDPSLRDLIHPTTLTQITYGALASVTQRATAIIFVDTERGSRVPQRPLACAK
jgi:hypothetical protein